MVAQQHSAMDWVKQAAEHKKDRTEQTDRKREQPDSKRENDDATQRRQALTRELGREIEEGFQTEIERGGRERTRG